MKVKVKKCVPKFLHMVSQDLQYWFWLITKTETSDIPLTNKSLSEAGYFFLLFLRFNLK